MCGCKLKHQGKTSFAANNQVYIEILVLYHVEILVPINISYISMKREICMLYYALNSVKIVFCKDSL